MFKVVVLISGFGTNLQAIIDQQNSKNYAVSGVICNDPKAYGIERAQRAEIPVTIIPHADFKDRETFDLELRKSIDLFKPNLIALAGFMRRLGSAFIKYYEGRLINIHPSLLPAHRGLHTHRRVLEAKETLHGTSVHFVTDDLDAGPVIAQSSLKILPEDDEQSLKERIQRLEHQLYPEVIHWFVEQRVALHGEDVEMDGKLLPARGLLWHPGICL